jgi:long-chain acyl-CoA synthetase
MSGTKQAELTIRDLMWDSFRKFENLPCIGFVDQKSFTYGEVKKEIEQLAFHLKIAGLQKGDKVAILGNSSPQWVIAYFTLLGSGIVAVPILPDFHTAEIDHIIEHSGVKGFFISQKLLNRVSADTLTGIPYVYTIETFARLKPSGAPTEDASWEDYTPEGSWDPFTTEISADDLATLIYTSGTTGFSKGVMLTNRNLVTNIDQCFNVEPLERGEVFLSILPLSHTLENTVGLLLPITYGASIHYIEKPPTASVLVPALRKIRPTYMLTVPLVIEKIFKSQVKGKVEGSALLKVLYKWGPFRRFFHKLAGKKLYATFGGRLKFFGIGGAKLDESTDKFLKESGFPYAIGYGLTETAPLLCGVRPQYTRVQSTGKPVKGVEIKINEPDIETGIGEIWARGANVMQGYYNEPAITSQVLMPDGWFRTGDLGVFDRDGFLYIKGRLKNVIIGASGENIYPEEIESVINRYQYVMESVVIEQKGRLVALVHFNIEELEKQFSHFKEEARAQMEKKIEEMRAELQQFVNSRVNRYSRVQAVIIHDEPFEKTATKKIKRYLYQK